MPPDDGREDAPNPWSCEGEARLGLRERLGVERRSGLARWRPMGALRGVRGMIRPPRCRVLDSTNTQTKEQMR